MGSEVRRAAGALVARREERFTTRRAAADARERLERALAPMRFSRVRVEREWREGAGPPELLVRLGPVPSLEKWLSAASFALLALIAAAVWAVSSESVSRSIAFLVPLAAVLAIFAVPLAAAALGSQREGEEALLRKAIRSALADE